MLSCEPVHLVPDNVTIIPEASLENRSKCQPVELYRKSQTICGIVLYFDGFSIGVWFLSSKALCLKLFEVGSPGGLEVKDHIIQMFFIHFLSVVCYMLTEKGKNMSVFPIQTLLVAPPSK